MLRIKLVKSPIGHTKKNRLTVYALGLRKVGQVVEQNDHPAIRGMIHKVKHLLSVEEAGGEKQVKAGAAPKVEKAKKAEKAANDGKAGKEKSTKSSSSKRSAEAAPDEPAEIPADEPVEAGTEDQPPAEEPVAAGEEK